MSESCFWKPTPRQEEFLACGDPEVLYGGAAGGGKTDALLIAALCLGHPSGGIKNPEYAALILRKSKPELKEIAERSKVLYPMIWPGAQYLSSKYLWKFPSRARVEFDHVRNEQDAQRFKGRAWNFIGFDELTLFDEATFRMVSTRCRSPNSELPTFIRATTNPDGPGQAWVMRYFRIEEKGEAVRRQVAVEDLDRGVRRLRYRSFIPARLSDNPHLDSPDYRDKLLSLPEDQRDALFHGRWVIQMPDGAYYEHALKEIDREGRIRDVPYEPQAPVNTFWDIRYNDCTAIWFHQYVAGEHRFLDCYQASGESLEHYAKVLQSRGYNLGGVHYLPHDAGNHSLQTGRSHVDMLRTMMPGLRFDIVPRVNDLLTGINQTRLKLEGNVFFDREKTAQGVEALRWYRKKQNSDHSSFLASPVRDQHTHLADAFRQWGQLDHIGHRTSNTRLQKARISAMAV